MITVSINANPDIENKINNYVKENNINLNQVILDLILEKIPYGETRSYKDIAIAIDNPKAVRAVGMANNRNKIAIFIPCHRVIGADGKLVGYGGGLHIKRFLLELEEFKIK